MYIEALLLLSMAWLYVCYHATEILHRALVLFSLFSISIIWFYLHDSCPPVALNVRDQS